MRLSVLVFALVFVAPALAHAETFTASLDGLVGVLDFDPNLGSRGSAFDFEQSFSSIESVSVEIEAQVFAQEFDVCGTTFNPQPCTHEVELLGFFLIIDEEDMPFLGSIASRGVSFSDDPNAAEALGIGAGSFGGRSGWNVILDGQGSLTLFWNLLLGSPGRIIENFVPASGEIFSAQLVVEATPIPEPSTSMLIAIGLFFLVQRDGVGGRRWLEP